MVNEINSSTPSIVPSPDTRTQQLDANKKVENNNAVSGINAPSSSSVNLTQAGTSLQALEKTIQAAPEVDQQKIDAIKKSINDGSYQVDAENTASKLVNFDTALPKSS
jgi:negative regulator of flagellin synthesis FlgM